jgi:hypothetical protein
MKVPKKSFDRWMKEQERLQKQGTKIYKTWRKVPLYLKAEEHIQSLNLGLKVPNEADAIFAPDRRRLRAKNRQQKVKNRMKRFLREREERKLYDIRQYDIDVEKYCTCFMCGIEYRAPTFICVHCMHALSAVQKHDRTLGNFWTIFELFLNQNIDPEHFDDSDSPHLYNKLLFVNRGMKNINRLLPEHLVLYSPKNRKDIKINMLKLLGIDSLFKKYLTYVVLELLKEIQNRCPGESKESSKVWSEK